MERPRTTGRPRTTTPPDEELVKLGEELLLWATEDIPDKEKQYRFRFAQWYTGVKGILEGEWDLMLQKPIFRAYYERARVALANRITDTTLREGIAHRFLRTYAPEVRHQEDQDHQNKLDRELDHKIKLLKEEMKAKAEHGLVSEDVQTAYVQLMDQISSLQSDRKSARSRISKEAKS